MSKGSPVVPVRISEEELRFIQDFLAQHNDNRPAEPMTLSDFIRRAVRRDIAKIKRSREQGGKRRARRVSVGEL